MDVEREKIRKSGDDSGGNLLERWEGRGLRGHVEGLTLARRRGIPSLGIGVKEKKVEEGGAEKVL